MEESTLPFGLKLNEKFALMAVRVAFGPKEDQILTSGLRIYSGFPKKTLSKTWRSWLGEIASEHLDECDLLIVKSAPSLKPEVYDNEHHSLEREVSSFFAPLGLVRTKMFKNAVLITGSVTSDGVQFKHHATVPPLLWHEKFPIGVLTKKALRDADVCYRSITNLHGKATHLRIFRGLKALMRAWQEQDGRERLHFTVRALDAVTITAVGRGKRDFKERCQMFVGASQQAEQFFESLYQTRSDIVHMNDLSELRGALDPQKAAKKLNAAHVKTEIVTTELYRRIFSDATLLHEFRSDDSMRDFWAPQNAQIRTTLFGKPIDVSALRNNNLRRQYAH